MGWQLSRSLIPVALDAVPATLTGGVVAVGSFDGMHAGHRVLLDRTRAEAERLGGPAVVLTFEPHPRTVLRPDTPVFRLTPLAAKARLLAALGIDGLVVAAFDRAFAAHTAQQFVEETLIGQLRLKGAVVGYNFHFGKGRAGSPAMLAEAGERAGFAVTVVEEVSEEGGETVSSTAIRGDLAAGEIGVANRRLGYRWFVIGKVIPGDRRGRELGFPTANLRLEADCRLRHGIYAVRLERADGTLLDGVASYGRRPTFDDGPPLLEVHAFDFAGDLYGETVTVSFVAWIRPEVKFASVPELVAAIGEDCAAAKALLREAGPGTALDRALTGGG
jgi:riboflavin kinase/FMN adenylyltransferase